MLILRKIQDHTTRMLFHGGSQFRTHRPGSIPFNRFDFHGHIIQKAITDFDPHGRICFRFQYDSITCFSENIDNHSFIIAPPHPADSLLFIKLMQFVNSTDTARIFIVRNINIIIILRKSKKLTIVFFALNIGAPHLLSLCPIITSFSPNLCPEWKEHKCENTPFCPFFKKVSPRK